ncbi:heterokaryon incompatibility protein-domain-containing protein [Achaetomium macrosporum]|uniref:Heterokaryon incompatibility protein-domain-containing protein n=1 Tax=Achaetomium macrosporum TaxID=79813 RepID=A0AAN7H6R0_9PEZI|nr:heterokaryon incompatibility protein-domain-containing protein [Achaetomium macrosporum]
MRGVVYPPFMHHSCVEQLEQAAFENCPICRKLWSVSCSNPPKDRGDGIPGSSSYWTKYHLFLGDKLKPPILSFMVDLCAEHPELDPRHAMDGDESFTFAEFRLTLIPDADKDLETEGAALDAIDAKALAHLDKWAPSIKRARQWLRRCVMRHERCKISESAKGPGILPSRLLQIGSPSPDKDRLVYPRPGTDASRYATVSHCWGNPRSHTVQLNSLSASRLQQGIEIADLGQTFHDVIRTAQCLGIHHIWIDSLCIYQDSRDDWAKESTLMSTVYRNGTINKAATAAPDGQTGCFPRRETAPATPCVVQTAWDNFENRTFGIYCGDIWDEFKAGDKKLPLLSRGWVVQEMLLAPRVLHLAGKQLIWQCRTVDACEDAPFGVPHTPFQYPPAPKWRSFWRLEGQDTTSEQEECRYLEFWSTILRDYIRKSFTYHTDKLVAMSGIAGLMTKALGLEYFAGIWGRWMASDLCWKVERRFSKARPDDLPHRPSPYRAPSWSWACLEEPIDSRTSYSISYDLDKRLPALLVNIVDSYPESESDEQHVLARRTLARILDCHVETVTDNMMGAVTGGTLGVLGRLAALELQLDGQHGDDRSYSVLCSGSRWT